MRSILCSQDHQYYNTESVAIHLLHSSFLSDENQGNQAFVCFVPLLMDRDKKASHLRQKDPHYTNHHVRLTSKVLSVDC